MKEQKNLKINVPEGYEIDKDKSTFEEIVFKKTEKKGLPERWEDLGEIDGWYVDGNAKACEHIGNTRSFNKDIFATEAQAKASVALAQLSQLLKVARDGWEPDWSDDNQNKHYIFKLTNSFGLTQSISNTRYFLSFPTEELAEEFLLKYKDLIKEASPLLFG